MLSHGQFHRHIHKLLGYWKYLQRYGRLLLIGDEAIYSSSGFNIYWTLLRRCRYMELLFSTCYLHSSYHRTISSSDVAISNVCKYSGTRFAPINVPNSAGSVCITTFLLMTHVCHVVCYGMSCSILLHAIVYSNMS